MARWRATEGPEHDLIFRQEHHATILEINTESYRRRTAAENSATANKARAKFSA